MTENKEVISGLSDKFISAQIVLGNDIKFPAAGSGSSSFRLDSGASVHMNNILYVPGLKRNVISVSAFEYKGYTVGFSKGKVLVWEKKSSIN